ncbi:hypothetical protein CDD80_6961 [Ophiocordyceps camponoti-rufipedis]|uniref:Mannose-6-phosphate isomerase n=1 Tax=Ophiocordyceps camponoti-rufipedis TaxID=2004952 RepID=A0A2C5YNU2_9HYPO|nr:hypothetical protein CDD80_6961 [Ophiocordyceps camponoti-rufipedis]
MQVPLFRLRCGLNSYEWGKKGSESAAARFAAATPSDSLSIDSDKPYSELWMGSHPSNPSRDIDTGRTLSEIFADNKALLSAGVAARYGDRLPFLLKILSIDKALSIQAHPNKKLAEQLHARDPRNYPDDNHKPEMAIAITPFEGLCGFRPLAEIAHFLASVPPLRSLVGDDNARRLAAEVATADGTQDGGGDQERARTALRSAFGALMSSDADAVAREVPRLVDLARSEGDGFAAGGVSSTTGRDMAELVTRLHHQFGADIGLFVLFFLNFVRLQPGEALFLVADDIHAYVSGDIVECMAASDNVVRAGLTPKFKDVTTLVDMLTYRFAPIDQQKMVPTDYPYATLNRTAYSSGSAAVLYDPPIDEFAVVRTQLRSVGSKVTMEAIDGPSIVICTAGRGSIAVGSTRLDVAEGFVFFVGSSAEVVMESTVGGSDDDEEFITFRAICELPQGLQGKDSGGTVPHRPRRVDSAATNFVRTERATQKRLYNDGDISIGDVSDADNLVPLKIAGPLPTPLPTNSALCSSSR